jgi:hypothetical protein
MKALTGKRAGEEPSPSWWAPVLLALPALIPLAQSLIVARLRGEVATGFITYDMPYYMANAREHFDQGFQLLYGNPYAGYDTPAIYFQPQIFLLGCLERLGLDPGLALNLFGIAALFLAAFVAVRLYREVVGWSSPAAKLGLLCFFWGGGVLSLAGLVYAGATRKFNAAVVLHFDLGQGWWSLNFGRNLAQPTEAYYHAVFLLVMLFLIRRRFAGAIALAALLSASHPFTGLTAVLIVAAYLIVERLHGDGTVKPAHIAGSVALVALHLGYYVFFLNRFADHRALVSQWEKQWLYQAPAFVLALALVGLLALVRLSRWPGLRRAVQDPRHRLFLVWFLIVFGLTQHFRLVKPVQPVHFAHGYDWMALFFLGSPLLLALLDRLLKIEPSRLRYLAVSAFLVFFLFDNLVWFAAFLSPNSSRAMNLRPNQKEVLDWLDRHAVPRDMVVSADQGVSFFVPTYTRVRSWYGHAPNTPHFQQRLFEAQQAFEEGAILPAWNEMRVFYVAYRDAGWKPPSGASQVFHNARFEVWECPKRVESQKSNVKTDCPLLSTFNFRLSTLGRRTEWRF